MLVKTSPMLLLCVLDIQPNFQSLMMRRVGYRLYIYVVCYMSATQQFQPTPFWVAAAAAGMWIAYPMRLTGRLMMVNCVCFASEIIRRHPTVDGGSGGGFIILNTYRTTTHSQKLLKN
jgi:hypothetical protein